jgi:hypothetical protein
MQIGGIRTMGIRVAWGVSLLILTLHAWGCRDSAPPVAELEVEPTDIELAYPGFLNLRLSWQLKSELGEAEGEPLILVHLLDEPGSVIRTCDHELRFDWEPGRSQEYEIKVYQSALAPPLPAGEYHLSVGLYDLGGNRWPLAVQGEEVDRYEYSVAKVSVSGESENTPMFYFSPSWLGLEGGTDRQVLGRRWLTGEGTIRVAEIPTPGSLWMAVRIPALEPDVEELNLEEGAEQPAVLVASSCGGAEIGVSGFGTHEIEVSLGEEGSEPPDECEVTIKPNFYLLKLDTLVRRSVALDLLSWAPAES